MAIKLKIRRIASVSLAGVFATVAISCASSPPPKKQDEWPESKRTDWEHSHEDDPCMEKGGEPRRCTNTDDCCKGFLCSIDASRSRVYRYCLEG
jgi:hypothetical protein